VEDYNQRWDLGVSGFRNLDCFVQVIHKMPC